MASITSKKNSTKSSPPIHDPSNAPLLDYIHQSAKAIQRTELTVGFLTWLVMGLGTIFIFVVIDHWVFPFNGMLRYAAWFFLVGGSLLWLMFRVVPLLGRSINPEYAAKRIEDTIPEMKDGLISWIQLASHENTSRGVLNAVGRYVAKHLKGQEVATVIDQFAAMKLAAMLFGLTLISAIYLAVSPKSGIATISRLLMPWANIAPSTRVQIVGLTPGDATVTEGSSLPIAIQVRGWHRGDTASIRYATDDGQTVDQTIAMSPEIEGLTYAIDFGKSFGGLVQPIHYFVEAGDAKAGPFAIRIQAVPLVLLEQVEYVYPAYMRLATRTADGDGRIEAPEGTRVTIRARSNQPITKARIEFDTKPNTDGVFRIVNADDVTLDGRSISALLLLELDTAKSNPTQFNYRIRSENERGEENAEPVVYPIKVIADLAPEVQLASGLNDSIDLPVNQKLDLEVRAMDPDFGLANLSISGTLGNQRILAKELFQSEAGFNAQVSEVYSFDPLALRLQPGMQVEIFATAKDNRRAVGSDQPEPNIRQSRVIRVRMIPPGNDPANTKAANKPSPDSSSQNTNENVPSDKSNIENSVKDAQPKPDQQNSRTDEKNSANNSPKDANKSPTDDASKQSKQDGDSGESDPSAGSNSSDSSNSQPKEDNRESNQPKGSPENSETNPVPNSNQEQPNQGPQPNDSSNSDRSDQGSSGAGQSSKGQEKNGGAAGDAGDGNAAPSSEKAGSGKSNSSSGSQPSQGSGQRGEPLHDGEAFDKLQSALQESGALGEANGEGKSTNSSSTEGKGDRSPALNEPSSNNGKPSAKGIDQEKFDGRPQGSQASEPNAENTRRENNASNQKAMSGADSENTGKAGDQGSKAGDQASKANDQASKGGDQGTKGGNEASKTGDRAGQGGERGSKGDDQASKASDQAGKGGDQGTKGGDEASKAGDRAGQGGKQGSKEDDQASKASDQAGKGGDQGTKGGDEASKAGDQASEVGDRASNQTDPTDGKSSESSIGESGSKETGSASSKTKGGDGQPGKAQSSQPQGQDRSNGDRAGESEQGSQSSSKPGKATQDSTGNRSGKDRAGSDDTTSEAGPGAAPNADHATAEVEYARQATDMILKALDRQRDQPDPELLKRMGWNKEQLQAFLDRWKNARDQAAKDPQRKRDYDESLRSLGLMPNTGTARNEQGRDDRLRGLNEEGSRVRPPESLRERFEAFRKSTLP